MCRSIKFLLHVNELKDTWARKYRTQEMTVLSQTQRKFRKYYGMGL